MRTYYPSDSTVSSFVELAELVFAVLVSVKIVEFAAETIDFSSDDGDDCRELATEDSAPTFAVLFFFSLLPQTT